MNRLSVIIVSISLFLVTAAANLQMPLYVTYAAQAGYGMGLTAIVFFAYIAGLLPVLICFGGVSERMGQKPIIAIGLLSSTLATGIMIFDPTIQALIAARFLQGIGVGLSVGAGTAYLARLIASENRAVRGANIAAVVTSLGFGSGALLTSIVILQGIVLVPWSYWVVFAACIGCLAAEIWMIPTPTLPGRPSLVRLPHYPAKSVPMGLAIAVAWAVTGLVITVIPDQLAAHRLVAWGGAVLFLVNGTGALVQPFIRKLDAHRSMRLGFILLVVGYGALIVGAWQGMMTGVLLGAVITGSACYGFIYLAGLTTVSALSGEGRARAVSGYYLFAYLGLGVPSVGVGFAADAVGSLQALVAFGVIVLIACAWLWIKLLGGLVVPMQ